MAGFVEILVTMLPPDAGGRTSAVSPRDGTYRPIVRSTQGERARVRFLEGPPRIAPGDAALVVAEVESDAILLAGDELEVIEPGERLVGIATLVRFWRAAITA
jgi:hypothetical protein